MAEVGHRPIDFLELDEIADEWKRIGPELRLPLTPLDPTHSSMLKRVLSELGL